MPEIRRMITGNRDGQVAAPNLPFSTFGRILPDPIQLDPKTVGQNEVIHWSFVGPLKSFRFDQLHELTGNQLGTPVYAQVVTDETGGFLRLSGIAWRPQDETATARLQETQAALSRFWQGQDFYLEAAEKAQLSTNQQAEVYIKRAWQWLIGDGGALDQTKQYLADTWESVSLAHQRAERWVAEQDAALNEMAQQQLLDPLEGVLDDLGELVKETYIWLLIGALVLLVAYNKSK